MRAIGIGADGGGPRLLDVPRPEPKPGEVLVRTLRVGVDGTDHEVVAGAHGGPPPDAEHLVLGHEAVGVVVDPTTTDFEAGDVVAPMVRRPPPDGTNEYFERAEPDMAPPDECVECGIDGAHGFMSEYFTSPAPYLIPVPETHAEWGFLVEPISVSEKALDLASVSRSSFTWTPETALVLGNGPLGLVTVAMLVPDLDVYCLGRRDRPDPSVDLVENLGATYVDGRETPVDAVASVHEPMDLVYEATGYAKHAVDCVDALAPNGVAALLGVPQSWEFSIDGGQFHRELVMTNKALVGSVNAGPSHFHAAVDRLASLPEWFFDDYVTEVAPVESFEAAFDPDATMKTAVEFGTQSVTHG
ncbi:glucose 1-dehydrogenase [Haloplanus natans]|uniref:glucose 1-dehydrogenase n=1 Tax=Haloplanus natans TaxID=376171 RepID=UPI000677D9E0|nr:glucose 1-dehydrogenase [Haloplanus natans]